MKKLIRTLGLLVVIAATNAATVLIVVRELPVTVAQDDVCLEVQGNLNGDDIVNVADAIYLLSYLFKEGPAPVACAGKPELTGEEIEMLQDLLEHVEVIDVDDPESDDEDDVYRTVRFTDCNVQIVNGLGATNGDDDEPCAVGAAAQTNGLGNLIIGYNELREPTPDDPGDIHCDREELLEDLRSGSHNLVVGARNNYTSFGGVVLGRTNEMSAPYATVTGGFENEASFLCASVVGGTTNTADGGFATVVGGRSNVADAFWSVVVGGGDPQDGNVTSTAYSVVVGGIGNIATGVGSVVVGGQENDASGENAVAVGGEGNQARATSSVVSGGQDREATGTHDWVAGSLLEDD